MCATAYADSPCKVCQPLNGIIVCSVNSGHIAIRMTLTMRDTRLNFESKENVTAQAHTASEFD